MVPDPDATDINIGRALLRKAHTGWYLGDMATLERFSGRHVGPSKTNPRELVISLLFSRDRMHHSVGWWRNSDYEYCYHLSLAAWEMAAHVKGMADPKHPEPPKVDIPDDEVRFWARLLFGERVKMLWHEPGGTDPRLSIQEKLDRRHMFHLRLFMHPLTLQPFIPQGEVYHLTRWIPGLTPEKVDR